MQCIAVFCYFVRPSFHWSTFRSHATDVTMKQYEYVRISVGVYPGNVLSEERNCSQYLRFYGHQFAISKCNYKFYKVFFCIVLHLGIHLFCAIKDFLPLLLILWPTYWATSRVLSVHPFFCLS